MVEGQLALVVESILVEEVSDQASDQCAFLESFQLAVGVEARKFLVVQQDSDFGSLLRHMRGSPCTHIVSDKCALVNTIP